MPDPSRENLKKALAEFYKVCTTDGMFAKDVQAMIDDLQPYGLDTFRNRKGSEYKPRPSFVSSYDLGDDE